MTELLFRDDAYLRSCSARVIGADPHGIRLDRTVFYPMGGGQPGDAGVLRLSSGQSIAIADTIKGPLPDEVIHVPTPGSTLPEPGTELFAEEPDTAVAMIAGEVEGLLAQTAQAASVLVRLSEARTRRPCAQRPASDRGQRRHPRRARQLLLRRDPQTHPYL